MHDITLHNSYVHTRKARGDREQTSRSNIVDDYEEACCLQTTTGFFFLFSLGFACRGVAQSPNCHPIVTKCHQMSPIRYVQHKFNL